MRSEQHGVTLIEAIIAMGILAFAMVSVFSIYTYVSIELRRAKNRTLATQNAQAMMEMIHSSPHPIVKYDGLTTDEEQVEPPDKNPVWPDLLMWRELLKAFPSSAIGTISVSENAVVTVTIRYDNYGMENTAALVLHFPLASLDVPVEFDEPGNGSGPPGSGLPGGNSGSGTGSGQPGSTGPPSIP